MFNVTRFDSEAFCGYKQFTTFFEDFGIAEHFGKSAVKDTYRSAMQSWKTNYKYLTELVMVLNWKSWEHANRNPQLSELYADLFYKARDYALDHLKGEELSYFLRTTD